MGRDLFVSSTYQESISLSNRRSIVMELADGSLRQTASSMLAHVQIFPAAACVAAPSALSAPPSICPADTDLPLRTSLSGRRREQPRKRPI